MDVDENKRGLVRQAIVVVGLMLAGSVLISMLAAFGIMSSTTGLLIALVAFVGVALLIRQNALAKELRRMRGQGNDLAGFERAIDRKLEKFSTLHQAQIAANNSIEKRIQSIETKLDRQHESGTAALRSSPMTSNLAADDMERQDTAQNASPASTVSSNDSADGDLDAKDLTMHLQPIVELSSRKPMFYQGFVRLATGPKEFLEATEFSRLIRSNGLSPIIDQKVISSAIRMADSLVSMKKKAGIFCALSPDTLANETDFSKVHRLLKDNKAGRSQLLIQISQHDLKRMDQVAQRSLVQVADMGYRLALSDTYDFDIDPEMLASAGFRYVFAGAESLLAQSQNFNNDALHSSKLAFALRTYDIELVITDIDQEAVAADLVGFDVGYGQGLLFAPPRPVKPELLEEKKSKQSSAA